MLQRLTGLALVVAALVLSLAGVGLYGSVAFITAQRTREIAIRMAIGAPRRAVLRMLLWEGAFVVLLGCAAGMALTGVAFQFMSGMIFAKWTLEPFAVAGVLCHVRENLAACYVPGRRATRIDHYGIADWSAAARDRKRSEITKEPEREFFNTVFFVSSVISGAPVFDPRTCNPSRRAPRRIGRSRQTSVSSFQRRSDHRRAPVRANGSLQDASPRRRLEAGRRRRREQQSPSSRITTS